MGDFQKALSLLRWSAASSKRAADPARESTVLNNLCVIHDNLENHKQALDSCQQALSLRRELKDKYGEAITLNNIGNAYSSVGEYQKTLDYYIQSKNSMRPRETNQAKASNSAILAGCMPLSASKKRQSSFTTKPWKSSLRRTISFGREIL
jgi:tetratricopeptide (TPR) repeat protein